MEASQAAAKGRFSSLVTLIHRARVTFERFPLVLIAAIGAAAVLHRLADIGFDEAKGAQALYPILMTCVLAVPLFFSVRLLGESRSWPRVLRLGVPVAGLAALLGYYTWLPYPIKGGNLVQFFLLFAVLHLVASFAPFIGRQGEENGFWQYNKVLFLRFATAALYSTVLWIGLSLAIGACETLLDFDFDSEIYLQLWYWAVAVYNTWFFLAGIPEDVRGLQTVTDYPTALRVFSQYVLIPLVAIYLVILYAYLAKILIEWNLPKGWVGYPVTGVAVTGMLAYLLVYPIREQAESAWIATYAKFFNWLLLPLIGLMAVAIGTRIAQYGLTEPRYIGAVATAWLLGIAIYSAYRKRTDIRAIPVSLAVVALLSTFGPWSATAVSRANQLGRLRAMLVREEVMTDGLLVSEPRSIEFEREKEISNIVKYLHDNHGLEPIRSWYARTDLPQDLTPSLAMKEMGLEYIGRRVTESDEFYIDVPWPNPLAVEGYGHLYEAAEFWSDEPSRFQAAIDTVTELSLQGTIVRLGMAADPSATLEVDLAPAILDLRARDERGESLGPRASAVEAENEQYRLTIYLKAVGGSGDSTSLRLRQLTAVFLVAKK
jgi:hypothetical protein